MKRTAVLAAASLLAAGYLFAQQNTDLPYRQNVAVKKSHWNRSNRDDTNNIDIELSNKSQRSIRSVVFEIVANDKQGTRLQIGSGYSRKLFSTKKLSPNSTGTYSFINLFPGGAAPEEVQISNIHVDYEGGAIEDIRLEVK